ncbi:hypothetical protein MASR1M59_29470 [Melaminivora sp.]
MHPLPPSRLWRAALLAAGLAAASLTAYAAPGMDATLSMLAAKPGSLAERHLARSTQDAAADLIPVTIRFSGSPFAALQALGVRLGSTSGNIVTAQVPRNKLREAAQVPGVEFMEASRRLPTRLSMSVPATGATQIRGGSPMAWTGATGQGVIVGIVDDGLDFRHRDFLRADGSTRLLGLWDMRANAGGSPPAGFQYGNECSSAEINQAIAGGLSSSACTQPSTGNHGTHVGGIAAGNGQATGNGQAAFRHVGMAPMADLIAANAIGDGVETSNAVIDAIHYIKARAQALGKPAVVNLSLGSYYGNRDGTSNYETALTNATGPGFIITAAAGNEGADPIRAEAALAQGQTVRIGYRNPSGGEQRIEMWYPGTHRWSVRVSQGSCSSAWVAADTETYEVDTPCGALSIANSAVNPLNGDRQVLLMMDTNGSGHRPSGDWIIEVQSVQGAGTVSMIGAEDIRDAHFIDHVSAETKQILTDTCSATGPICVGAYVTRQQWQGLNGQPGSVTSLGAIGEVGNFSSRGPRRNCSVPAQCPMVAKPEILAPGAMIISALGHDAEEAHDGPRVDADGQHVAYLGTSMATPHVTGAIALLLQKNPQLTPAQARQLLLGNLQRTAHTPANLPAYDPAVPNPTGANDAWGYGIMDIARAWQAMAGTPAAIAPHVSGDARSLSVSATLTVPAQSGAQRAYVVAVLPNGALFTLGSNGQWQPYDGASLPAYGSFTGPTPYEVQVLRNLNHAGSGLGGTAIFVGYGSDEAQMLQQQQFALIHILAP